jgi:hypothetical protein
MQYQSENCWPDLYDLQNVLKRHFKDKELSPGALYQDFRTAFEWLQMAIRVSHWNGRHSHEPLSAVKEIAESFIGRVLSEDAFLAAVFIVVKLNKLNREKAFDEMTIKIPPFDKEKIVLLWEQHVAAVSGSAK